MWNERFRRRNVLHRSESARVRSNLSWNFISQNFFLSAIKEQNKGLKMWKLKVLSTTRTVHGDGSVYRIIFALIRLGKLMEKSVIPVVLRPHYLTFHISSDLLGCSEAHLGGEINFSSFCKQKNWVLLKWAGRDLVLKHVHNLFIAGGFFSSRRIKSKFVHTNYCTTFS